VGTAWLAHRLSEFLGMMVTPAFLEALEPSPRDAVSHLLDQGVGMVVLQPLLLGEGQHLQEIRGVAQELSTCMGLQVLVGESLARHPYLASLVARRAQDLLAGQPNPQSLLIVKAFTRYQGGDLAWATDLAFRVAHILGDGCVVAIAQSGKGPPRVQDVGQALLSTAETLAVLPCVLFGGKTWEEIANAVAELRSRYGEKRILMGEAIGPCDEVVAMLAQRVGEVLLGCPR